MTIEKMTTTIEMTVTTTETEAVIVTRIVIAVVVEITTTKMTPLHAAEEEGTEGAEAAAAVGGSTIPTRATSTQRTRRKEVGAGTAGSRAVLMLVEEARISVKERSPSLA